MVMSALPWTHVRPAWASGSDDSGFGQQSAKVFWIIRSSTSSTCSSRRMGRGEDADTGSFAEGVEADDEEADVRCCMTKGTNFLRSASLSERNHTDTM